MVDRLLQLIKKKGLTVSAVEKKLGFGNGAIKRFATNSPSIDKIIALSDFLNVSVEYILFGKEQQRDFSEDTSKLLSYYKVLNDMDKGIVLGKAEALAELAAERAAEQEKEMLSPSMLNADRRDNTGKCLQFTPKSEHEQDNAERFYVDICSLPASAGTGVYLDDSRMEPLQIVHTDIAERANYAVRVSGDSMMPDYNDGDIVLVETCPSVDIGEIGIFVVDGEGYIKKYGGDKLISLNHKYPDISLRDVESASCRGRVLGIAEPIK